MSISVTPHLNFQGDARPALAFYQTVFGGDLTCVTYEQAGAPSAARSPEHVMWGQVVSANGFRLMAYDVQADRAWNPGENASYIVVGGAEAETIQAYWSRLSESATILQPLAPSAWAPLYGMLKDRFGITWVLSVTVQA